MTWNRLYRSPPAASRSMFGVAIEEPTAGNWLRQFRHVRPPGARCRPAENRGLRRIITICLLFGSASYLIAASAVYALTAHCSLTNSELATGVSDVGLSTPFRSAITAAIAAICMLGATAAAGPALAGSTVAGAAGSHTPAAAKLPLSAAQLRADQRAREMTAKSGGSITGIAETAAGTPLAGICVTAYGPAGQKSAVTRQAGQFLLSGLRPGRYQLHYRSCDPAAPYLPEWYGDTIDRGQSNSVVVSGLQLQPVRPVTLYPVGASSGLAWPSAADPRDQASQIAADPFGSRSADPTNPSAVLRSLVGPAKVSGAAQPASGATAKHGRISGIVTSPAGKGLAGICVEAGATGPTGGFGEAATSTAGRYTIGRLPPGTYEVIFIAHCGSTGNWLAQVYKGKDTVNNPTPVRVRAAKTTSGINAVLRRGGEISGTVTGPEGKKLNGICVDPLLSNNAISSNGLPVFGAVSRAGVYHVRGIPAGSYQLGFAPCNNANYAPTLWPGTQNFQAAATIVIKPPETVTNIDEVMQLGGTIKGTVTSAADPSVKLGGMCVIVQELNGLGDGGLAVTDAAGNYVMKGLAAGSYAVAVQAGCGNNGNYVGANYPSNVTVTSGVTASGIDVALPTGAIISGIVTGAQSHLPIAGICVDLLQDNEPVEQVETARQPLGSYSVNQLPAGTYEVQFGGGCGNTGSYAPQGYDNTSVLFPQDIVVAAAADLTGIDAAMQPGPTISGTVTSSTGAKLSGICALAISPGGIEYGGTASSGGRYELANLAPGQYQVGFGPGCGNNADLAAQWFRSQASENTAALVSAASGAVTGIDAVLPRAGGISGHLKSKSGHNLQGACMQLSGVSGAARSLSAFIFVFGSQYEITGMPLGSYQVVFEPNCLSSGYATEWYKDQPSPARATNVTVQAGRIHRHIDSAVVVGGTVAGQVTKTNGEPARNVCVFAQNVSQPHVSGGAITNKGGHYTIKGLNTGRYELDLSPCGSGTSGLANAIAPKLAAVTASRLTTVNAVIPAGGSVRGTVLGESPAAAQPGVCVLAQQVGGVNGGITTTIANGSYTISNLPAGRYQVFLGDPACGIGAPDLAPQWYPDSQTELTAEAVTVTAGTINLLTATTLSSDGSIAGTVTAAGKPLAGVCVAAAPPGAGQTPIYAVTGSDGSYGIADVTPGQYLVQFSSGCGASGYLTQWWRAAASAKTAKQVSVQPGTPVTNINAAVKK